MHSFSRENLQNIKDIFQDKTGVILEDGSDHRHLVTRLAAAVVIMVCSLGMTAFAYSQFSSLSGDELSISADYQGDGIVWIHVENRSDKELDFQPRLKLMEWSASREIKPLSQEILFTGTTFEAGTGGIMTVDLSKAYDMDMLEQPLADGYYYFVLTNNHFMFGQDWMCPVDFAVKGEAQLVGQGTGQESAQAGAAGQTDGQAGITGDAGQEGASPMMPVEADPGLVADIPEEIRAYFESYTLDLAERNRWSAEYTALCQELLDQVEGTVLHPVSPMELTVKDPAENVMFDTSVPSDMQLQLTGLHRRRMDGYDKIIGASDAEEAMVLSAYIPQKKGDVDGGVGVPLLYIFIYETENIQKVQKEQGSQGYVFIRGRLMTLEQMEAFQIYEDGQYTCYEVSDLFYTDLRQYVESMVSQRSDVYFDEQVWERVRNIYDYYRENLGKLLGYRDH